MTDPVLNTRYRAALEAFEAARARLDAHIANRTMPSEEEFKAEERARTELIQARRALLRFRGML